MTEAWSIKIQKLSALSGEQRLHFFEVLAHNLTVVARIVGDDRTLSVDEQLAALKVLNECLHLATSRVWVQRLNTHSWTDESFIELLSSTDAQLPFKHRSVVAQAFDWTYGTVQR